MLRRNISNFRVGHTDLYRETSLDPNLSVSIAMPWLLKKPASTQKNERRKKEIFKNHNKYCEGIKFYINIYYIYLHIYFLDIYIYKCMENFMHFIYK